MLIGGQIVAGEPTGNGLILNYSDSYDGRYAISTPILPATQQQVNYTCTETGPYRYYKITADGVLTQYTDDTFTEAMPETNLTYMFDPTVLNLTLHTQAGSENAGPLEGVKFEITLRDSLGDPIMVRTVTSNSDGEVIVPINIEDLRNVDTYDIWAEEMGRPNGYYLSQINPYDSPGNPVQIGTITLERIGCSITGNNTEWIYNPLTAHMVITLRGQDPTGVDSGALSGSFEVATLEENGTWRVLDNINTSGEDNTGYSIEYMQTVNGIIRIRQISSGIDPSDPGKTYVINEQPRYYELIPPDNIIEPQCDIQQYTDETFTTPAETTSFTWYNRQIEVVSAGMETNNVTPAILIAFCISAAAGMTAASRQHRKK